MAPELIRPPIFAYLRPLPGMNKKAVRGVIGELIAFCEREGFALAGMHFERRPSQRPRVWGELVMACRRERVADVVVPSAAHFHQDPAVAAFMRAELAEKIGGTVWLADEVRVTTGTAAHDEP